MKFCGLILLLLSFLAIGQDEVVIDTSSNSEAFQKVTEVFAAGKYQETVDELEIIRKKLKEEKITDQTQFGLIAYWKGIAFNRMQKFSKANKQFRKALKLNYSPKDINYEYGQSLYATERLASARTQFKYSLKKRFKRAVCLYYIGYISRELKDRKNAIKFFQAVEKLPTNEGKEVLQAAEMQIADIYLSQVEKKPYVFKMVEDHVIPQYQKAKAIDPESSLAPVIEEKIVTLQKKYDLVLFNLENGRATLIPPYFLRLATEIGNDSNVTFSPTETTVSKANQASTYGKIEGMGRYTFYLKKKISLSPEFRYNRTRYFNRIPDIYRNDNYLIAPAFRTAYEHTLWKKPASVLLDYDFNRAYRDVESNETLKFSSDSHTYMLGERFNYFDSGESIIRFRHRSLQSYLSDYNSKTTSLVWEQIKNLKENTLLFLFSYDQTRAVTNTLDTNAFTFRTDLIMSRFQDWFTPSFGIMFTSTDPINNRTERGRELLINPSARLSRTFGKNWRGNLKYDYTDNNSKDKTQFAYRKTVYSFQIEYIF